MAEIKNTFTKSKMNKDLDDRLVPTGEYRDALNIAISRSEGDDVGALENILGNSLIFENTTYSTCIGVYNDRQNEKVYYFLTNYIDASANGLSNLAPATAYCAIVMYDKLKAQNTILVAGSFLNFSARSPITGVNVIEDLLFWTDNRNQPRKININTAIAAPAFPPESTRTSAPASPNPYYISEDHISVAKYYPWKPIVLTDIAQQTAGAPITASTMTNPSEKFFPNGGYAFIYSGLAAGSYSTFTLEQINGASGTGFYPYKDDYFYNIGQLINYTLTFGGNTYTVTNATITGGGLQQITIDGTITISPGDEVLFQKKPDYDATWPGDPDFLKDRFIRLSYRFRFDDNEYSLMAPFTQPCFIPKQYGYFLIDDQEETYRSTVVNFFENNVTQIIAAIEFETINPKVDLKVKEVEILYKESDALQVKVIERVDIQEVMDNMQSNVNPLIYEYKYISNKPYKGLPEDQITRVFDQVPTKALAQEVAGNRVIYGNFVTTQTPPKTIDYHTNYGNKLGLALGNKFTSQIEYPNHTVKQNRNYQVGFVLADRYGRQSSVILSSNDEVEEVGGDYYGGSTVYVPYKSNSGSSAIQWPGYSLRALVNSPIPNRNQSQVNNYAGLYNSGDGSVDYIILGDAGTGFIPSAKGIYNTSGGTGSGLRVQITATAGGEIELINIYENGTGYTDGDVLTVLGGNNDAEITVSVSEANVLGWYSYKIVVRQTEQDYYNVYLPGILDGYPANYINDKGVADNLFERGKTSNVVLINDNINKVPRDLSEVGPDQKQYKSSVRLFGRVSPINNNGTALDPLNYNRQYYPTTVGDTVVSISTLAETNYNNTTGDGSDPSGFLINYPEFYQSNTNPLIARINTVNQIGKSNVGAVADPANNFYENTLAVYETDPAESLLDIYWETTSSGLISDLNLAVVDGGYLGAIQHTGFSWICSEGDPTGSDCFNGKVTVINGFGNVIYDDIVFELDSVTNGYNQSVINNFAIDQRGLGTIANPRGFNVLKNGNFYYGQNAALRTFNFTIKCIYTDPSTSEVFESYVEILNQTIGNEYPTIHETSNPLSPLYVQTVGEQDLNFANTYRVDTKILTVYGQNGCNPTSGLVGNELVWNLIDDMEGRVYIVTEGRDFAPGQCEVWLYANPATTGGALKPVTIELKDANNAANTLSSLENPGASQLNLQYSLEAGNNAIIEIGEASPICDPWITEGGSDRWDPQNQTGRIRYEISFTNLQPGTTYNNIQIVDIVESGCTLDLNGPPIACRIPSSITNSTGLPITEEYYFDIIWQGPYRSLQFNMQIEPSVSGEIVINSLDDDARPQPYAFLLTTPAEGTIPSACTCDAP
jgi:hypothetical protein